MVLVYEFQWKRYFLYTIKPALWYSVPNHILIPAAFWACFLIFLACYFWISAEGWSREAAFKIGRRAFLLHLFLVMLCQYEVFLHSPDSPATKAPPVPFLQTYRQFVFHIFFVVWYFCGVRVWIKRQKKEIETRDWFFILSAFVPLVFLMSPEIHGTYLVIAAGLFLAWSKVQDRASPILLKAQFAAPTLDLALIFLVGLGFRLWYAHYFSRYGLIGFGADGPDYYRSAAAFASGNFSAVNYWYTPQYSLYLAAFLKIFGSHPNSVFYGQAVLGSFVPLLAYGVALRLGNRRIAFLGGTLTAASHLCIHYSVALNRGAPLTLTFLASIYLCLLLKTKNSGWIWAALGGAMGTTLYLGPEMILALALMAGYAGWFAIKKLDKKAWVGAATIWILGAALALGPLNAIYQSQFGEWIPLGRGEIKQNAARPMGTNLNPYSAQLFARNFNLYKDPAQSLLVFLDEPLKISELVGKKILSSLPGFLFDLGGIFLTPLHLKVHTFWAAHLQFYIYFFVGWGTTLFIFSKQACVKDKILVLGAAVCLALTTSFIVIGTFRFRAPITPINMILVAWFLDWLWSYGSVETHKARRPVFKEN